jgi:heptosyltransferase-1
MTRLNADPRRILIIRPSGLGDVARSVPVLASLKRAHPEAQIDWLVRRGFEDAIRHHPDLNEAILFNRKRWTRSFAMMRDLRRRRYDRVYDLQGLMRSAIFTRSTGAPRRVGLKQSRECATLGYNIVHDVREDHVVDRSLGLLAADGVKPVRDMRLYTSEADRRWLDEHLAGLGMADTPYAVVAPTALWASKRWPIDRFVELARRLPERGIEHIFVVGAPGEQAQAAALIDMADPPNVHNLVGTTTVGQLMALIERCALAICHDSAALHMAVGLGRRAIGLYGLTDPRRDGPYRYPTGVVKAPVTETIRHKQKHIDDRYMARITVDDVRQAVDRVLASPPPITVHAEEQADG